MKELKIKKIEKISKSYKLYDLETKNHNFYANDILVHNSNGSVCYSLPDGLWVQSKEQIITPENDNAGCAFQAMQNFESWVEIITTLAEEYGIDLWKNIITIYFEWCGTGIQTNTAVQGLDKMAMIFRYFKVSPIDPTIADDGQEKYAYWLETNYTKDKSCENSEKIWIDNPNKRIFNISKFPTYELEIDFGNPLSYQNKMIEIVENIIEPDSPVGNYFGIKGNIGEGIVFTFVYKGQTYTFKIKGSLHSKSKVKTLKKVDDEKLQKIQEIAQAVTPAWRLEQMYAEANNTINGEIPDMKNMGIFLKLLANDIIKEESDIIVEAGLEPKDVFKAVPNIARPWYKEQLDADIIG